MLDSSLGHLDLITELVKLCGPKSYLAVGVRHEDIEASVRYKSINRLLLCGENEVQINRILVQQQFLGEVEWFTDLAKISHRFDFVHVGHFEYRDLILGWKLCKNIFIIQNTNVPSIKEMASHFLETINMHHIGIAHYTGDQGTLVLTK